MNHGLTERDHMHSQLSTLKWMDIILGPFKLLYSVIGTVLLITGYSIVFLIQALCFSARGNRDGIIEAFGWYGRSVINAVSDIFKS